MTTSEQVLSLGADLVIFLAGVSLVFVLMLRPDLLGASAIGRTVLVGAAMLLATAALIHGALVEESSRQDWVEGFRTAAVVLLAFGCLGVGNRWPRTTLLGALAVLVVAEIGFREARSETGDLLRFIGGIGMGISLLLAARRSLATRISAAAGVLLVIVVLVLSGVLSTVLTDNVSEQAIRRASARAELEADLIFKQADAAVRQASFLAKVFELGGARDSIRTGNVEQINAFLRVLRSSYEDFDFLAFFGPDKNILGAETAEGQGLTILGDLSASPTVEEAFQATLAAPAGGVEPTVNNGLVAIGVQLIEFNDERGEPTRYGAIALGSYVDRAYLLSRQTQKEKKEANLTIVAKQHYSTVATTFDVSDGETPPPLDGEDGEKLILDVFDRGRSPEGTGTFQEKDVLYAVAPIGDPRGGNSQAAVVASLAGSVVENARVSLFRTLFLVALGAAGIALALAAAAGSRLGAPLRGLAKVAEQISQGDLSVRSGLRSPDEIGLLGSSFDEMAGSIERMTSDLREGQAQMEAVLHSMADGLVAASPLGLVQFMNPAAEAMLGVRASREIGKPVASVLRAQDRAGNPLDDRFEMPDFQAWRAVGTVRHRDTLLPVALAGAPIRNESGGILGAVYVIRDMRPEMEVEKAKTEFLSNISHELRTPLTPIKAYAGMLKRDLTMPEARRLNSERVDSFLDEILDSSERLERTIDILVSFAQMEAGKLVLRQELIDVNGLVTEVCARWRSRHERHRVEEQVNDRPRVMADRKLLERSIDELVDNAIKFSPKGGEVNVRAQVVGEGDGRAVEFSVSDQGIGISPGDMENMFKEFTQADGTATRAFGGLGLGLPFVQRVVKAHHGSIDATSEPGRGSTFVFRIPVNPDAAAPGAPASPSAGNGRGAR